MTDATLTNRSKRLMRVFAGAILPLAMIATACSDDPTEPDVRDVEFAAELNIDIDAMTRTQRGLYYQELTVGDGETAAVGSTVNVLYRGWLPNGTLFDEVTDPDDPLGPFTLGNSGLIPGFEEGFIGMRVGGVRKLVIPPSLAYGNRPNGPIPANSFLVFEVTLLSAQ